MENIKENPSGISGQCSKVFQKRGRWAPGSQGLRRDHPYPTCSSINIPTKHEAAHPICLSAAPFLFPWLPCYFFIIDFNPKAPGPSRSSFPLKGKRGRGWSVPSRSCNEATSVPLINYWMNSRYQASIWHFWSRDIWWPLHILERWDFTAPKAL